MFIRPNSQEAIREFRPYFDNAPVYGHGPALEDFMRETPLTVGSPQEVIERTLTFREHFGDYQRQLFLADHAGSAAEDGAGAVGPARRAGDPRSAQGVRRAAAGARARRPDARRLGCARCSRSMPIEQPTETEELESVR